MKRRDFLWTVVAASACTTLGPGSRGAPGGAPGGEPGRSTRLDEGWRFMRADVPDGAAPELDDAAWEQVALPHTARIEALVTGEPGTPTAQWQGICWYRRTLRLDESDAGRKAFLRFDGAMNVADVWLDGVHLTRHLGGYLPFVLDVSEQLQPGIDAVLAVRLDNRDDPVTGPKPLAQLDFNMYHGLYRHVHFVVKDRLHVTDPIFADRPGSGGVLVTVPRADARSATVHVQTHVRNEHGEMRTFVVRTSLIDADGEVVARHTSRAVTLGTGGEEDVQQLLDVDTPRLWSPRAPSLYTVRTEVVIGDRVVDVETTRVGIRRIAITRDGFSINGETMFLRGTNRHQEYPYVGYALSDEAQYRDARRIKEAGFDYVRLSHYPHAPAFMDACDELGIVVMNCIPGWQYFGRDPAFAELQYRNVRELIRRDRNHPSVILWEVSLNETEMPPAFIRRTHAFAHDELPGDQTYTCGWVPGYDVLIRARQHGGCPATGTLPCIVSEYGDWEYYAMTAGLHQEAWQGLTPDASNSRQLRWHGERAMLQQATNFQEAHDDNIAGVGFGDGLWVMYDYNRGYAPDIESSGCMDIFRLPKYAYHFFRSQRDAGERVAGEVSPPMVFVASEWTPSSATDVRVYSNAPDVEVLLNGRAVGRHHADDDRISRHLAHAPFTFRVGRFEAGTLEAIARQGRRVVARHVVRTPGPAEGIRLDVALAGRPVARASRDVLLCHARLHDAAGTVIADAWENVAFGATGGVTLVGANPFSSDAGIASIVARTDPRRGAGALYALAILRDAMGARLVAASTRVTDEPERYELRYTTDGSVPTLAAARYSRPIAGSAPIRAALVAGGRIVVELDERTPKFRIRGSAAPEKRDPFRHG